MQPLNALAPFKVDYNDVRCMQVDDTGLNADTLYTKTLKFADGSIMTTAGAGLPANIDSGTF